MIVSSFLFDPEVSIVRPTRMDDVGLYNISLNKP